MLKVFKGAWPSEEDQFEWFGVIWPDEAKIRCHYPRSLWSKRNTGDTIRYLFQVNPTLVTSRHHSPRGANANTRQGTNCQGLCPCWEGRKGCYLFVWTIHEINMNRVSNFEPSHSQRMKTKITWTLKSWLVDRIPHLKSENRPTTTFKWSEQKYIWDITPKKWRLWVPMVTGTLALFLTLKNPFSNKKNGWRGAIRPKRTHIFRGKLLVFTGWHMFHWWPFFLGQFKIYINPYPNFKAVLGLGFPYIFTIYLLGKFPTGFLQNIWPMSKSPPKRQRPISSPGLLRANICFHTYHSALVALVAPNMGTSYASLAC